MKVLIVDDQRVIREGLATIVGVFPGTDVVGEASDGQEAVELLAAMSAQSLPDVILMDLRMPRMDGVEATKAISERFPTVRVVVLTTYADDESVVNALAAGAVGYLTKDASREDIHRALDAAAAGLSVMGAAAQSALVGAARNRPQRPGELPDSLTEREAEVLGLIAQGLSNTEISETLYVAESTVKTHVNRIFAKTGSRDRAQAAAYAHRNGLVP
ncbi:MAG TPA: response regulator transcription factor [Acidimicrobiales bacterium]|nr:response regulator transcription factor [Acidimicrobiales bacterium]